MSKLAGLIAAAGLVFTIACGQTDAGITTNVKTKLAADDTVKAYQVDVSTRNRVVTLNGEVQTSAAREQAVKIARETDGVRDVIDQLRVSETAATSGSIDVDVTDDAKDGAEAVGDAAKKGANAVKKGAQKAGDAVKDAVTDDDRDSDKDGK